MRGDRHCHPANIASRPLTVPRPAASGKENSADHAFRKRLLGQSKLRLQNRDIVADALPPVPGRERVRQVAHAAARTHGVQFGPYKQQLAKRRGAGRAVVATTHKILRIVFAMLRDGKPYCDPQIDYQARMAIKNKARWLNMLRKANLLQDVVSRKAAEQLRGAADGGRAGPLAGAPEPLPA